MVGPNPSWFAIAVRTHREMPPSVAQATGANGATDQTRIAVLGASGYTGEEVVRLLALHPSFSVTVLTGETQAGKVRLMLFPLPSLAAPWININIRCRPG